MRRAVPALSCATWLVGSAVWVQGLAHAEAPELSNLDSTEDWDAVLLMSPPEAVSSEPGAAEPAGADKGSKRKSKGKSKARKATGESYRTLSASWHQVAEQEDGSWGTPIEGGPPPLVLRSVAHDKEPVVLTPASDEGGFDETDVAFASQLLGTWDGGPSVDPHLLDLIYLAVRHFEVPYVRVVSGIRKDRKGSRHSHGLAADIVLPGVKDEDLAALFRAQGFVGVGVYTKANFVHIDVRERSYFWVDTSAPGRRGRIRQVRAEEAKAVDEAAMARGEGPKVNPDGLQKALDKRSFARWKRNNPEAAKARDERRSAARAKKREEAEAQAARRAERKKKREADKGAAPAEADVASARDSKAAASSGPGATAASDGKVGVAQPAAAPASPAAMLAGAPDPEAKPQAGQGEKSATSKVAERGAGTKRKQSGPSESKPVKRERATTHAPKPEDRASDTAQGG